MRLKKKEKRNRMAKSSKRRKKMAVLVTTVVFLQLLGLYSILLIFEETTAIFESPKMEATKLDTENLTEELDEGLKEPDSEDLPESGSKEVEGKAVSRGSWGTATWEFDSVTGVVKVIGPGSLGERRFSPWDSGSIDKNSITKIELTGKLVAQQNSSDLSKVNSITGLNQLDMGQVTNMQAMFFVMKLQSN